MKQFDFERAWQEVALPAYKSLPQNVRDLYVETDVLAKDVRQNDDLSLPWPPVTEQWDEIDLAEFKQKFIDIPSDVLAKASLVIFYYGHWGKPECYKNGTYWKFSKYADRVLRSKICARESLGPLPDCQFLTQPYNEDNPKNNGLYFKISNGMILGYVSTTEIDFSTDIYIATICRATKNNFNHIKKVIEQNTWVKNLSLKGSEWEKYYNNAVKLFDELKDDLIPKNGFIPQLLNASKNYVKKI